MDNKKVPKKFYCIYCDYSTCKNSQYERHILTDKHQRITKNIKKVPNDIKKIIDEKKYKCGCGKEYNFASGLSKHKNKCNNNTNNLIKENKELKEIILEVMSQNKELIKTISEMVPKISSGNITNNNNSNNTTFNLQLFLNEKCKNALNINDFVKNLEITIDDLNFTKNNGLVKGITDVMVRGLKELDIYKRPIHCTDGKRETMYIKDEEKWEKDENNEKIKEVIIDIANKERESVYKWKDENPLWKTDDEVQDEFMLLVNRVYTPIEEDDKCGKKIIKNISKEVILDR